MSPKNTSFWLAFAILVAPLDRAENFRARKNIKKKEGRSKLGHHVIATINIQTKCFAINDKINVINGSQRGRF